MPVYRSILDIKNNKLFYGVKESVLNSFFDQNNINAHFSNYKSMMNIRFRKQEVLNYKDAQDASGGELYKKLFLYLLKRGIYWPPAELETFFVSGAHTKKDLKIKHCKKIHSGREGEDGQPRWMISIINELNKRDNLRCAREIPTLFLKGGRMIIKP